ncbi:LysE/ArgO family amino acid transporter [Denitrificimonas sp. JX-1]|uniref:LysE/ArgO family amino acid transporter n=1 Tax=Denitrificimonas halotolerans TaxID=3098930 RepID=A0ABU5GTC2_9GAMM|nr:LysE/ArgO family amino acid transporter [Denitrificimonas sp. JX-1]MDY7219752.1 LysE/ArgO family amino acid transporter [Denitrificimonas sp. JX-1]
MLQSYVNGLLVLLGLIMAIGAQNAFLVSQALRREHHFWVASICAFFDVLLVAAGVYGLAHVLTSSPLLLVIARWGGILFLSTYALLALRRAFSKQVLEAVVDRPTQSLGAVTVTTLAVTLLNPHVYLDTVLLIGSLGAQQDSPGAYVLGSATGSILWFFGLAVGAAQLAPWLARPMTWRVIDFLVALMMIVVALQLLLNG